MGAILVEPYLIYESEGAAGIGSGQALRQASCCSLRLPGLVHAPFRSLGRAAFILDLQAAMTAPPDRSSYPL